MKRNAEHAMTDWRWLEGLPEEVVLNREMHAPKVRPSATIKKSSAPRWFKNSFILLFVIVAIIAFAATFFLIHFCERYGGAAMCVFAVLAFLALVIFYGSERQ